MADPVNILLQLDARAKATAAGLPQQEEVRVTWDGLGFMLGQQRYVAPLSEVVELLTYPGMSRIPGTKHWVKGIANIRGSLMPVLDLNGFLTGHNTALTSRSRVLALSHEGLYSGLLVDAVLGLKHFYEEDYSQESPAVDAAMQPFLRGSYTKDNEQWGVFSIHALAESQAFMEVAV